VNGGKIPEMRTTRTLHMARTTRTAQHSTHGPLVGSREHLLAAAVGLASDHCRKRKASELGGAGQGRTRKRERETAACEGVGHSLPRATFAGMSTWTFSSRQMAVLLRSVTHTCLCTQHQTKSGIESLLSVRAKAKAHRLSSRRAMRHSVVV